MKWNTSHHETLQRHLKSHTPGITKKGKIHLQSFSAGAIWEINQALRMEVAGSINGFMNVSQLHAHGTSHEGDFHSKGKMSNFLGAFSFRVIEKIYACFWQTSPYTGHLHWVAKTKHWVSFTKHCMGLYTLIRTEKNDARFKTMQINWFLTFWCWKTAYPWFLICINTPISI